MTDRISEQCKLCHGLGSVPHGHCVGFDGEPHEVDGECPECHGDGFVIVRPTEEELKLYQEVADRIPHTISDAGLAFDAMKKMLAEIRELRKAVEESVKLQSHYAKLLNMYDGGERIVFKNADEWMDRLQSLSEPEA